MTINAVHRHVELAAYKPVGFTLANVVIGNLIPLFIPGEKLFGPGRPESRGVVEGLAIPGVVQRFGDMCVCEARGHWEGSVVRHEQDSLRIIGKCMPMVEVA